MISNLQIFSRSEVPESELEGLTFGLDCFGTGLVVASVSVSSAATVFSGLVNKVGAFHGKPRNSAHSLIRKSRNEEKVSIQHDSYSLNPSI